MCGALVVAVFLFPNEEEGKNYLRAQWVSQTFLQVLANVWKLRII